MTDYTLKTLVDTPDLLLVRLTPPEGGEMQSTRIAFLPGPVIVIHGDLCPGENGLVSSEIEPETELPAGHGLISNAGYGREWFARGGLPITPSYMAEKFRVPTVFSAKRAAEHLRECAEEADEPEATDLRSLAEDAEDLDERDPREVGAFLEHVEHKTGSPDHAEAFYGPDPRVMGLLIQIQAAFARLWKPTPAPLESPCPSP